MPNRSIRDDKQSDGRPKVGPADPDTRRRMLQQKLSEREPTGLYGAEAPAPKQTAPVQRPRPVASAPSPSPTDPNNPTRDLSAYGAAQKLKARKQTIDDASGY